MKLCTQCGRELAPAVYDNALNATDKKVETDAIAALFAVVCDDQRSLLAVVETRVLFRL